MDAEHFACLAMKNNLEASGCVPANLTACDFTIVRDTDLVRSILFGKLLLGFSGERNLGNRVNSVWISSGIRVDGFVVRFRGGDATLLHRDRGETRESTHVTNGEAV